MIVVVALSAVMSADPSEAVGGVYVDVCLKLGKVMRRKLNEWLSCTAVALDTALLPLSRGAPATKTACPSL